MSDVGRKATARLRAWEIRVSEPGHVVELRTDRLLLRPFRLEDVDDVFEYARDPEWTRFLPVPQPSVSALLQQPLVWMAPEL